jgi:hypothetical protein
MDNIGIPRRPVSPDLVAGTFLSDLVAGTFLSWHLFIQLGNAGGSAIGRAIL